MRSQGDRKFDDPHVRQLARDLDRRGCAAFVGAGVSVSAGLPTWPELIDLLRAESGFGASASPQRMADYARQILGPRTFNELLQKTFSRVTKAGPIQTELAKLNLPIFITTNFDCLLEQEIHAQSRRRPTVLTHRDTTQWLYLSELESMVPHLLKIHGCIERTPTQLVLTEEDYLSFSGRYPHVVRGLGEVLARHPVVFIGYSLSDWDIASILWQLSAVLDDDLPNRYFVGVGLDRVSTRFLEERYRLRVINLEPDPRRPDPLTAAVVEFITGLRELFQVPDWLLDLGRGVWTSARAQILPSTPLSSILPDIDVTARVRLALRLERYLGREISLPEVLDSNLTVGGLTRLAGGGRTDPV